MGSFEEFHENGRLKCVVIILMDWRSVNSKNFLRVVVQRHIIINFYYCFLQACIKIVPMSELTFKDYKVYLNNKLFLESMS